MSVMTEKELYAVQERHHNATKSCIYVKTDLGVILESLADMPLLLEDIKTLKSEITEIDRNSAEKDREYKRELQRFESESDRLQKRNEALERAIKYLYNYHENGSNLCELCKRYSDESCEYSDRQCAAKNHKHFILDEERFSKAGEQNGR